MSSSHVRRAVGAKRFIVSLAVWFAIQAAPVCAALPPCRADQLTLRVDGEDGRFAGMSQDGVLALVRNVGATACSLPALPSLTMANAAHATVAHGTPPLARFMHPGPVMLPVGVAAGAIAAAQLHWISSDVFSAGRKAVVASLVLQVEGRSVRAPLQATLWSRNADITFDQARFTTMVPSLSQPVRSNAGT